MPSEKINVLLSENLLFCQVKFNVLLSEINPNAKWKNKCFAKWNWEFC